MDDFSPWRRRLQEIIFEAETPAGKAFDVLLILCILASVCVVMLDSVHSIRDEYGAPLYAIEWGFTILFTVEYGLRLVCIGRPIRYAWSFYGIVDLMAILPTYLSVFVPASHYLVVIRTLRVLRVFRVLKIAQYVGESEVLMRAMLASRRKIIVFLLVVLVLAVVMGSFMYVIEGEENGFTSIPRSVYWAIVTLTTVGYGNVSPQTPVGQALAALIMILGYGIIAVPTGIVTVEISQAARDAAISTQACPSCSAEGHDYDALYCNSCGTKL